MINFFLNSRRKYGTNGISVEGWKRPHQKKNSRPNWNPFSFENFFLITYQNNIIKNSWHEQK